MFSSSPNWMGEEGLFWRVQKHCEITPRALGCHKRQKVSPFVKFEIMLPLLCFLLDPLQISIAGHNMINLWINSRTCQKSRILLLAITLNFRKKTFWGIWCCYISHTLRGSSLWYGFFTKFLNWFFRSLHHVLEIYVLSI